MLGSDQAEPDGVDVGSVQARWLEAGLARPAVQRGLTIPARG